MSSVSPMLLGLAAALILAAGYAIYQATIPKPIPGIPYLKATSSQPFGDLFDFISFNKRTKELVQFITNRPEELNTPVCQLFVKPFRKPWVVLADAREAQDIMARRWREFDRGGQFDDMFGALVPHGMVIQPTNDKWRSQRRLAADTMSPQFLHNVVAPIEEKAIKELLAVWQTKTALAKGHPFSAYDDIDAALLDNIIAVCFGSTAGAMDGVMKPLSSLDKLEGLSADIDDLAVFPAPAKNEIQHATATVIHSANIGASSPLGILHHKFAVRFYPELRRCVKVKDNLMTEKLDAAWKKFNQPSASEDDVKSATDLFVAREVSQAAKQKRKPVYDSPEVRDELFTFLLAGWETTATALKWAVKHLTAQQEIQHKLRQSLRSFYKDANTRGGMPSHEEVVRSQPAYLNAVLEEILRHSTVAAAGIRTTTQDVEVLGYNIPKGTDVWMPTRGKGMLAPSFPVEEAKRSKTSQFVKPEERWTAKWDDSTLDQFLPERWLRPNKQGELEFDGHSGPMRTFGAGLRGCFGRKLAMMSLRMLLTYIVWSFELLPVPERYAGFEAEDRLTWEPQQVHLILKRCES